MEKKLFLDACLKRVGGVRGPVGVRGRRLIYQRIPKNAQHRFDAADLGCLRTAADPFLKDAIRWFRRGRLSVGVVCVGGVCWSSRC